MSMDKILKYKAIIGMAILWLLLEISYWMIFNLFFVMLAKILWFIGVAVFVCLFVWLVIRTPSIHGCKK